VTVLRRRFAVPLIFATIALMPAWSAAQSTRPPAAQRLQFAPLPVPVDVKTHGSGAPKPWVRYVQCQIAFDVTLDKRTWLPMVVDAAAQQQKIAQCVRTAREERADVLILPEVASALPAAARETTFASLAEAAQSAHLLIVAGSYYDDARRSRIAYFGPGWRELGYKIRPSRFEVSPVAGHGMAPGESILLLQTDLGNIAAITCVDLISDDVQASVRRLIDERRLDVLININYNPASLEFLIEANSLARRHPVFVSITNAVPPPSHYAATCKPASGDDDGYCYGHTAVFAGVNANYGADDLGADLAPLRKQLAYNYLVADTGTFRERALVYDLNMRQPRLPADTAAPDQGYPTIRNVKVRDLAI
jgi:predicted amidohydrolase